MRKRVFIGCLSGLLLLTGCSDVETTKATTVPSTEAETETYAETVIETQNPVQNQESEELIELVVHWNAWENGEPRNIEVNVYGVMDDGSSVYPADTEGEYIAGEQSVASQIVQDGYCELLFKDTEGVFTVSISNGEDWATKGLHILDYELSIQLYIPDQGVVDIKTDEYYVRAGTGIWIYQFTLDHGQVIGF